MHVKITVWHRCILFCPKKVGAWKYQDTILAKINNRQISSAKWQSLNIKMIVFVMNKSIQFRLASRLKVRQNTILGIINDTFTALCQFIFLFIIVVLRSFLLLNFNYSNFIFIRQNFFKFPSILIIYSRSFYRMLNVFQSISKI